MRFVLEYFLKKIKKDTSFNLDKDRTSFSVLLMLSSMFWGLINGKIKGLSFKEQKGLIFIKKHVRLINKRYISAGKNLILEEQCEIDGMSKKGLIFGDNVTIGAFAIIRPSNFYGGEPGEGLKIGSNSNIGAYNYIGCSGYIEIGENVMFGPRISIYAENHVFDRTDITIKEQGVIRSFVKIEDDCWIGSHSVILAGVTIGKGSIIAAGSIVTKDIPAFSVVAGVPAKIIKNRIIKDTQ